MQTETGKEISCEDARKAIDAFLNSLHNERVSKEEKERLGIDYDRALEHARELVPATKILCDGCWAHLEAQKDVQCGCQGGE